MAYLDKINVKGTEYDIQDSKAARQTEVNELKSAVDVLEPTATAEDEGKALIVKTVSSGKVSEYEFGAAGEGLTEAAKVALLNCFQHVAWIDEHGQGYYDALETALYPDTDLVFMTAVFTQGSFVVYPSTPLNDLKAYLTVTGHYNDGRTQPVTDYALYGTLAVGTSTITVLKDGISTTFSVTVSAPYWDYEWDASSKTLPDGMTAELYDFTTENGALYALHPILDIDYVGDIRLFVECKMFCVYRDDPSIHGTNSNNPQILIKNSIVSDDAFRGLKIIAESSLNSNDESVAVGINGVNTLIDNMLCYVYHQYDITDDKNTYTLVIDGTNIPLQQNDETTPYIEHTGISSGLNSDSSRVEVMYIKSIKWKKL